MNAITKISMKGAILFGLISSKGYNGRVGSPKGLKKSRNQSTIVIKKPALKFFRSNFKKGNIRKPSIIHRSRINRASGLVEE